MCFRLLLSFVPFFVVLQGQPFRGEGFQSGNFLLFSNAESEATWKRMSSVIATFKLVPMEDGFLIKMLNGWGYFYLSSWVSVIPPECLSACPCK